MLAPPRPAVPSIRPSDLPSADVEALYLHVPFCRHKCHYCDFYSITRQSGDRMQQFVDLVLREALAWARNSPGPTPRPRTIFFGGGTPSLLPLPQMQRLIRGLGERFDLSGVEEWTVEVNPGTTSLDYCQMLKASGVNRLSFGAQSFNAAELAALERHHDPADVQRSLEIARAAGFHRLNIDLIYAIPGQDLAAWRETLEAALELGATHLSCYGLTYEANTPMGVKKRLGRIAAATDETELLMLHHTRRRLTEAGLPSYEISNYAPPGEECKHNLMYWRGGSYIGLGPAAASHVEGWRWRNRPHLGEWERAVSEGKLPSTELEQLSPERRAGELAMLMLRLARGINYSEFSDRTGRSARTAFADQIDRYSRLGLLVADEAGLRLSETGIDVADTLAAEFLAPADS